MIALHVIGWGLAALALAGALYSIGAAIACARYARRREPAPAPGEALPATILKPLHGLEPGLERALETFFLQDYPAPVQIVFGIQDPDDPAIEIARGLCRRHPHIDTAIVVATERHGDNAKISNLINMRPAAKHPLIVVSDSDISVAPDYLSRVAAALRPAGTGAVTCLYTGWAPLSGLGARLSAMGVSYHFLPNVVMGLALGMARPCMGSTIALTAQTLNEIGGFAAFSGYLADDYEIGRAVRALGLKVAVPGFAVRHAGTETCMKDWFLHELRWMRTIRVNDPAGHAGSVVTHPLPLALAAAVLLGFSTFSVWVLVATLLCRAVLKWHIDRFFGASGEPTWLLPLRDVAAFLVFLLSLAGGPVEWRGQKLRVTADGVLAKIRGK